MSRESFGEVGLSSELLASEQYRYKTRGSSEGLDIATDVNRDEREALYRSIVLLLNQGAVLY